MRDKAPLERASEFPRLTEGLGGGACSFSEQNFRRVWLDGAPWKAGHRLSWTGGHLWHLT